MYTMEASIISEAKEFLSQLILFCYSENVLLLDFKEPDLNIKVDLYSENLKRLRVSMLRVQK